MHRSTFLTFALFALVGCQSLVRDDAPRLGERVRIPEGSPHLMIASAQMSPFTTLIRRGISYTVAVDDRNRIIYVATRAQSFTTPEGLKPGVTLAEVYAKGGLAVVEETGWGFYSELPSGWRAMFPIIRSENGQIVWLSEPSLEVQTWTFFKRR